MNIGIDIDCIISKTIIDKGLEFYNIKNDTYKDNCYKCLEEIEENTKHQDTFKKVYDILYLDKNNTIKELWKIKNTSDLFENINNPYITSLLLLAGYKIHESNMEKYSLDKKQLEIHKKRVKETLVNDIELRKYDGIRISQMLWGAYFVNIRIIEVGRLQYEFGKVNPLNEKEYKECIKIHIPSGDKLTEEKVKESIIKSKEQILKYFNLENPEYYCSSWLLSPTINKVIDKSSNIAKFYNMFEILEEKDGIEDILNFVFNVKKCNNYDELVENTSLQIKIKEMLLRNEKLTIGIGILK